MTATTRAQAAHQADKAEIQAYRARTIDALRHALEILEAPTTSPQDLRRAVGRVQSAARHAKRLAESLNQTEG